MSSAEEIAQATVREGGLALVCGVCAERIRRCGGNVKKE